jgi:putative Mg2+ transporter-C (MgtC) family protein
MRLGAQVVSGIGFLGAGTIVTTRRSHIRGLTTAAGLWAAAGIGLALGIGFYEAALIAGLTIFTIMTLLYRFDSRMHRNTRLLEIYVELGGKSRVHEFTRKIREMDLQIEELHFETDGILEDNNKGLQ